MDNMNEFIQVQQPSDTNSYQITYSWTSTGEQRIIVLLEKILQKLEEISIKQ